MFNFSLTEKQLSVMEVFKRYPCATMKKSVYGYTFKDSVGKQLFYLYGHNSKTIDALKRKGLITEFFVKSTSDPVKSISDPVKSISDPVKSTSDPVKSTPNMWVLTLLGEQYVRGM